MLASASRCTPAQALKMGSISGCVTSLLALVLHCISTANINHSCSPCVNIAYTLSCTSCGNTVLTEFVCAASYTGHCTLAWIKKFLQGRCLQWDLVLSLCVQLLMSAPLCWQICLTHFPDGPEGTKRTVLTGKQARLEIVTRAAHIALILVAAQCRLY